ncbi:DNA internalization-related competence protein ComEC/Rec2 [Thalassotalea litorea]|uniref:DNA internalization-related competence protein ComEC/Rec2 n=1 Tax=Thalassotalea litorea TaxID=2020715 RepID=UPI003736AE97
MERWLLTFLLGAILSLFLPTVPELFLIIAILIVAVILLFFNNFRFISGLLLGAAFIWWHAHNHFSVLKTNNLEGIEFFNQVIELEGNITTLVNNDAIDKRFTFNVQSINTKPLATPFNVRLTWYRNAPFLAQGQRVRVQTRLKPAHGLANPGSFSYQRWLLSNAIVAKGYVYNDERQSFAKVNSNASWSQRILENLKLKVEDSDIKPLILALTLGYRQEFEPEHWQVLQNTGTAHLMAISGLHLGIVATLGYWLGRIGLLLMPVNLFYQRWLFFMPVVSSLLFALTYAQLSNFSTPTMRAMIMLVLFWLMRTSHGKVDALRWCLYGMFVVVLFRPFSLISTSFWLSFCALISILVLVFWARRLQSSGFMAKAWLFIKLQLSLSLVLTPVNLLLFGQSPLLPWLANVWILPWFSLIIMPMLLLMTIFCLFSPTLTQGLIELSTWQLTFIWKQLTLLSELPFSIVYSSNIVLLLAFFGAIFFLAYNVGYSPKFRAQLLGIYAVVALVFSAYQWPLNEGGNRRGWIINVLDVGHGLSVVVEHNNKALIYDTGASSPGGQSIAKSVVHPFLRAQGLLQPDFLVVSHSDNDHAGGLPYLLDHTVPKRLIVNATALQLSKLAQRKPDGEHDDKKSVMHAPTPCQRSSTWQWQQLTITALWPETFRWQENEDSCVLLISDGIHNLLLTGDVPASVEAKLIPQLNGISIDVLIAPHHGSKSSSSQKFIDAIRPKHVIFSTGYLNRWNMPSNTVTSRYQKVGAKLHNTADSGMIKVTVIDGQIHVSYYRQHIAPLWFYNQFATLAGDESSLKTLQRVGRSNNYR